MYQFYYAEARGAVHPEYRLSLEDVFHVTAVRPTMWEEHCLECSAPLCFGNCTQYEARVDGRCKRFDNGIEVYPNPKGCCGQAAHLKFRRWGNMMTIVFPEMWEPASYRELTERNQRLGERLRQIARSPMPTKLRWESIRSVEYLRRRKLRRGENSGSEPDAFVFHGYSFEKESFHLLVELYRGHEVVFKTSLELKPGENRIVLGKEALSPACWTPNNLVKIYPEDNREAELDILWCDFVQGTPVTQEKPADKLKCLVWDLDNTLWDGILIETEEPGLLALRPGVRDLITALDERGILQSIASKNDYDAAWPVIEKLGLADYFLYPQIHWGDKSASLRSIAASLNIGVDALALIDDSAFERNQVQMALPAVRCYPETEVETLLTRPECRTLVTAESRSRRAMYRAEERRNQMMEADKSDTIAFLKKCNLRIRIFHPESEEELLRCYELVNRTNQLNMTGEKYSQEAFRQKLGLADRTSFAFSCEDDFGSYGIVGFGQYETDRDLLRLREFAMSCRVAGKFVESALFTALLERENCRSGSMQVVKTKKNVLLRRTLEEIGFQKRDDRAESVRFTFDSELKEKTLVKVSFDR